MEEREFEEIISRIEIAESRFARALVAIIEAQQAQAELKSFREVRRVIGGLAIVTTAGEHFVLTIRKTG